MRKKYSEDTQFSDYYEDFDMELECWETMLLLFIIMSISI